MFGGAGGQHGCSIATTLGIKRIIIPRLSSLLSAYGMALADVVKEATEPSAFKITDKGDHPKISDRIEELKKKAEKDLMDQGFKKEKVESECYLNCRYHGTSTQLMIEQPQPSSSKQSQSKKKNGEYGKNQDEGEGGYEGKFYSEHKREFGFNLENRDVWVDDIRVRAIGKSEVGEIRSPYNDFENATKKEIKRGKFKSKKVYFEEGGWMDNVIVPLRDLEVGEQVKVSP